MPPAVTEIEAPLTGSDYEHAVDTLIGYYRRVDEMAASLPAITFMPYLRIFWAVIKAEFAVLGDFFLIIPVNAVILLRNIFPGHWSYKSFSWKYFKIIAKWLWVGEVAVTFIHVRPVVIFLLHWHFRSRLLTLRRRILLDTGFAEEKNTAALAKIDRAMDFWGRSKFGSIVLTWILPGTGPAIEVVKLFNPVALPQWSGPLAIFTISYALSIPVSAFVVKRGLMLGGVGNKAYYPTFLSGTGYYSDEKEILSKFGIVVREAPIDILFLIAGILYGIITYKIAMGVMNLYEPNTDFMTAYQRGYTRTLYYEIPIMVLVTVFITVIGWVRRKKLGRL